MSTTNAGLAKKFGYKNVRVYLDGEPAWAEAGNLTYASKGFTEKGNIVLLDLRASHKAVEGRIKRAVSVPYEKLEDKIDDIPRNAPVVLYGDNEEEVADAVDDLRSEGFKFVSIIPGNYEGWVKSGGAVESGPIASTEIRWQRILGKGEVSVADFKKATDGEDPNVYVIDSRTKEEVAELGIFKNTVNIPLDEIPTRLHEFPKDKKIYVHCSTGARADMAYRELKKNGFDVKFLLLNISDANCDCEIIRP
jgi:rhodanese-related sulfurtransferase